MRIRARAAPEWLPMTRNGQPEQPSRNEQGGQTWSDVLDRGLREMLLCSSIDDLFGEMLLAG